MARSTASINKCPRCRQAMRKNEAQPLRDDAIAFCLAKIRSSETLKHITVQSFVLPKNAIILAAAILGPSRQ